MCQSLCSYRVTPKFVIQYTVALKFRYHNLVIDTTVRFC